MAGATEVLRDARGRRVAPDETGRRYGRLTVIGRAPNKGRYAAWHVRCDCGRELSVHAASLRSGNTESCGCLRLDRLRERECLPPGVAPRNKALLTMKGNARHRDLEWALDDSVAIALMAMHCRYCGAPPSNISKSTDGREPCRYNGIDRVDSERGYAPGNVVACCFTCNNAKHTKSVAEFEAWIVRAYQHPMVRKGW